MQKEGDGTFVGGNSLAGCPLERLVWCYIFLVIQFEAEVDGCAAEMARQIGIGVAESGDAEFQAGGDPVA